MFEMKLEMFIKDKSFPFFIQYGYHSGDFFKHTHQDFTELVIVMDGTAAHVVGKEVYPISKGDVFVIGGNTVHEFKNSHEFIPCNIMFKPEFFFDGTYQLKESAGFHALFYLEPYMTKEYVFQNRLKLNFEEYQEIVYLLEKLMREYKERQDGWKEMISSCFMELVILLSRKYQMPNRSENSRVLFVANAGSYIEKNFRKEITIKEMAEIACLSERHFTRIFRETYKITPMQYVIQLRLLYAASLLKNTTDTISEIAAISGFTDSNYFARRFRSYVQMSPGEYRRTHSDRDRLKF
jgi:AraC-like DNA-binding protein